MVGVSLKFFFHAFLYNRNICHFEFFFHGASGNFLYIIGEANVGVEGQGFTQDLLSGTRSRAGCKLYIIGKQTKGVEGQGFKSGFTQLQDRGRGRSFILIDV